MSETDFDESESGSKVAARIAREIHRASWRDLRAHAARDTVLIVAAEPGLQVAAEAVAADDSAAVQGWVEAGQLARPSEAQMRGWEAQMDTAFDMVVVAPFVLARQM